MKDAEVKHAIEMIRNTIADAYNAGRRTDAWSEFYMQQAQTEAILLLVSVIQEKP